MKHTRMLQYYNNAEKQEEREVEEERERERMGRENKR